MAAAAKNHRITSVAQSDQRELLVQFNALVAVVDLLLAKLDADAGVTDTNYAATLGATVSQIKSAGGATVTNP